MSFTATQDNLTHSIDQLADEAAHPHSARRSPSNNLFNAQFLKTHTCNKFSDFGHFVAAGFPDTDFESIPDAKWNRWIKQNTNFATWNDMKSAALKAYMAGRLTFQ